MEQREVTEFISTRYTMETLESASEELVLYEGEMSEMPTEEYVEWLERIAYKHLKSQIDLNKE